MNDPAVVERMRAEWNQRAREDANYYVAFGRREQDDEEFFATASDVVRALEAELKRLPPAGVKQRRALEIGCGPGRLMRPMSKHFSEIHGIDISDEMIRRAQANLRDVPHGFAHHAAGSDLGMFTDGYFDFVYSYAVFQHIPSRDVVFGYLREIARVLKPGGVAHCQVNGLPPGIIPPTTWDGVRISGGEIRQLARQNGLSLLALNGTGTQYMWTTWRKPAMAAPCRIASVSNAHSGELAVPATGRFSCASIWIENLPDDCDLNSLEAHIDGVAAEGCYIGPPDPNVRQFNMFIPPGTRTGLVPLELRFHGEPLCATGFVRVIAPGPPVPRIFSITDGINLMADKRIESGTVKVFVEEVPDASAFAAFVDGKPAGHVEFFCTDARNQRYDVSFALPEGTSPGRHLLRMRVGSRDLAPVEIEVAPCAF